MRGRHRLRLAAAVMTAIAALAVGACGGSSKKSGGSDTNKHVKLEVWGLQESPGRVKVLDTLTREFERKHPNVQIKWTRKSFNDVATAIKLALSGPGAPDVAQLPQGQPMVTLVKGKLLVPLDKYSDKYGWKQRFSASALRDASATPDGTKFGTGSLYGLSLTTDFVGIYYNKSKLAKLGLQPPKTFTDFENALAAAKKGGEVPIAFGDSDKWPAAHFSYTVFPQFVPKPTIDGFAYGQGPSFNTPQAVQAAATLQRWAKDGYLAPGYNGVTADQAFAQFLKGKGVFFAPGGSWYEANIDEAHAQGKFGFFVVPPRSGGQPVTVGTGGNPYAISSRSKNPDTAAEFLDYITSKHAVDLFVDVAGDVPGPLDRSLPAGKGSVAEIRSAFKQVQAAGLTPWMDWATPGMYDTLTANLQLLLGGKMSPQDYVSAAEKARTSGA
jgi:raffinose/stachyose/melibiose transport system substrate-binding protein